MMPTNSRRALKPDGVLFVERTGELRYVARLRLRTGAGAKASLKRAQCSLGCTQLHALDPKPGDLSMARVKRE